MIVVFKNYRIKKRCKDNNKKRNNFAVKKNYFKRQNTA